MEAKLILQGRHVFNITLTSKLRVVDDIFNTRATQFNGIVLLFRIRRDFTLRFSLL